MDGAVSKHENGNGSQPPPEPEVAVTTVTDVGNNRVRLHTTIGKIVELQGGLVELSKGYQKVVDLGGRETKKEEGKDGKEVVTKEAKRALVQTNYVLSGQVKWDVARNLALIEALLAPYVKKRNALIQKYDEGTGQVPEKNLAKFSVEHQKLLEPEDDIELKTLAISDLKLDENNISPMVLLTLIPIVRDP